MPTYTWGCGACGCEVEQWMSMREYIDTPPAFVHCGEPMARVLVPVHVAYVSESSYEGLRAPDGADISSRAKHREYMRRNNLTTIDDFSETWKRDAQARAERLAGADPERAHDIGRAIEKLRG